MFITTIPLHLAATDGSCIYSTRFVQMQVQESLKHAHVPFHRIIAGLQLRGSGAHSHLFQTMFQVVPGHSWAINGGLREASVKVDLEMQLFRSKEMVKGRLIFDQAIYESNTVKAWVRYWTWLLACMVNTPHDNICSLCLMDEEMRHRITRTWNLTAETIPRACLHELVYKVAQSTPLVSQRMLEAKCHLHSQPPSLCVDNRQQHWRMIP